MATFAELTKDQQKTYCNFSISHFLQRRKLITDYQSAVTEEERTAIQSALDDKAAEDISVDGWLASLEE